MATRRRRPLRVKGLELLLPLKRGGMGEVWLARRTGAHGFSRLVAVKLIRRELSDHEEARAMFLDEARVLASVSHPTITQAFDFGEQGRNLYLVLEYVPGVSLSRLQRRLGRPLAPPLAATLMARVARGLHAVHEQVDEGGQPLGIVHRDISPQNLMLGFDGEMKILDFGIALKARREAPETTGGLVKGKIPYVSPEQIQGFSIDRRSDVYAACVVLHELLTGRPLFPARTSPMAAVQDRYRVPAPSRAARVPRRLERLVMRGLAVDPDRRLPTARALAEGLEDFAAGQRHHSLVRFAETSLSDERQAHDAWLRSLAHTEMADLQPPPSDAEELEVASSQIVAMAEEAPARGRRRWALAAGFIFLVAAGATGLAFWPPARSWAETAWTQAQSALTETGWFQLGKSRSEAEESELPRDP